MWVCVFVLVGRLSSAAEFWCFPFTLLFARFVVVMQKRKESFDDKHIGGSGLHSGNGVAIVV